MEEGKEFQILKVIGINELANNFFSISHRREAKF